MSPLFRRFLIPFAAGLTLLASPAEAQRPALTGEKARVAEEVRADLSKLGQLQQAHHARTKVYAADVRDLSFAPTSGAQVNIAYASMNAWAANATHPVLSPIACFIIISAAEPTGPASEPFCQEGRPGATTTAAAPATTTGPTGGLPATSPSAPPPGATMAPATRTPSQPATTTAAAPRTSAPSAQPAATSIFMTQPAEMVRIVRDPYESSAEYEARRAAAVAAAQRREQEFFQANTKTYNVAMPVRDVRYDPDREVLEFSVDGIGLPITRTYGDEAGAPALTFTCYSRPVFWCSPDTGMTYEAGDLWRVSRAAARQHDVLRSPLVLYARFAVGRREDSRTLAISLLAMDLQARGQSVQRWDGSR